MQDAAERQPPAMSPDKPNLLTWMDGESTRFIASMLGTILDALRVPTLSDRAGDQVSDQVTWLLTALRKGPKTAARLMADMGLSHRPSFRKNYLRPAMSAGLVEMIHPESPHPQEPEIPAHGAWTAADLDLDGPTVLK